MMKIRISWDTTDAQGEQNAMNLAGSVSMGVGIPLQPESEYEKWRESYRSTLIFERDDDLFGSLNFVNKIRDALKKSGVVETELYVNGRRIDWFAYEQELTVFHLRAVIQKATEELKGTRKWLRDKRIAAIRQKLEDGLSMTTELLVRKREEKEKV